MGGSNAELARLIGIDSSVVNRRFESGRTRINDSADMEKLMKEIRKLFKQGGA